MRLYFYQTNHSTANLKPSSEYLEHIAKGLEDHSHASAEYCQAIAATPTSEPDRLVRSYLWKQPENRAAWLSESIEAYQRTVLRFHLMFLYRHSLTAHFIRY